MLIAIDHEHDHHAALIRRIPGTAGCGVMADVELEDRNRLGHNLANPHGNLLGAPACPAFLVETARGKRNTRRNFLGAGTDADDFLRVVEHRLHFGREVRLAGLGVKRVIRIDAPPECVGEEQNPE